MVNAANYDISNQYIRAEIQANGDLKIQELIVMDGTFNGYEKTLSYKNELLEDGTYENNILYNAKGIDLISIKGKYVNKVSMDTFNDTDFESFSLVSYASNGEKAKYTARGNSNGYTYRLYYPASNKKVAFLVTYMVDSVVVLHNDVAELYWNFISPNDYDDINDIKVEVLLPNKVIDKSNDFRLWLHGDISGEIKKNTAGNGVIATYDYMKSSSVLDIRLTFDKNLITDKSKVKTSNDNALEKIIEVETKRADIANNLREKLLFKYNLVKYGTIALYIAMLGLGILIYYKYGKSPKSSYFSKYNREFIDDYNVEVIDYLMNKKITPNAMSASIMNLAYKKNLSVKDISEADKKKKDYEFTLENTNNLNESENILVEFLFDKVGNKVNEAGKKIFTTKDLKSYASGTKTCDKFIASYTKWKNNVLNIGRNEKFFETFGTPKLIGTIVLIVGILIFILGISNGVDFIPSYFLPFALMIFFIYTIVLYRKTQKGSDHYTRWKAFKNFLDDFGSFELKELPEIVLWERYLVYATIFGLADKVQRDMNVRINELDLSAVGYDYYPSFVYINMGNTISNSVNNALSSAYSRQAANYSNSHSSSSSGGGFGGGASFGGGFGGGGSSGHGF